MCVCLCNYNLDTNIFQFLCNCHLDTDKFRFLEHHGRCLFKEGEYVASATLFAFHFAVIVNE